MRSRNIIWVIIVFGFLSITPLATSMNLVEYKTHSSAQTSTPNARYLPGFVYDPVSERVMMFGGGNDDDALAPYSDTWVLDAGAAEWTQLVLEPSPVRRHSTVMVYDSADEVIILFGGHNGTAWASDTWVFDCNTEVWTEVTPTESPHSRGSHAMVYDSTNERVLMFSGYSDEGPVIADTWAYDYNTNTWEEMNPSESPHARYGASCIYDSVSESMIIYGGNSDGYFSDTWRYDYVTDTWTELEPAIHPQALKWSVMTYDTVNQKAILFGGDGLLGRAQNETWTFDPSENTWEERTPVSAPPAREAFGFAYDVVNEKAVLFGGTTHNPIAMSDTWAYSYATNSWVDLGSSSETTQASPDLVLIVTFISVAVILSATSILIVKKRTPHGINA